MLAAALLGPGCTSAPAARREAGGQGGVGDASFESGSGGSDGWADTAGEPEAGDVSSDRGTDAGGGGEMPGEDGGVVDGGDGSVMDGGSTDGSDGAGGGGGNDVAAGSTDASGSDGGGGGNDVAAIAANLGYSCAVRRSGQVKCWGANNFGQLGVGDYAARHTPAAVDVGGNAIAIGAGYNHACAVLDSGAVKCWGDNGFGQLGDGGTSARPAPGPAVNLMGVRATAVTASFGSTCALLETGAVKCWGDGANGLLGNGDTSNRADPVSVSGLSGPATLVSCGYFHCCALVSVGQGSQVSCWGDNAHAAIGAGSTQGSYTSATTVANLAPRAIGLAAGEFHTCGLLDSGDVLCWGDSTTGALGIGFVPDQLKPSVAVDLGAAAAVVAAGNSLSCAILGNGDVRCWGSNVSGGLGIGSADASTRPVPAGPVDLGGHAARAIAIGNSHVCVVLDSGELKCWGQNESGQLGLGDTDNRGDGPSEMGANLPAVDLGP